jgi:hypothetical protein
MLYLEKAMIIKVLGFVCMNCKTLEKRTIEALQELNMDAVVEKIEDYQKIASYGIMRTPGLVVYYWDMYRR